MLESINPFNDPDFKKQILESEGKSEVNDISDADLFPTENDELKNIISSAPTIPNSAKNMILDASAIAKSQKDEKVMEINLALNNVFTEYNKEYGTNLQIDFNNLSNTLINVANPETRKTLELYVSEVFKSIRPVLLLHVMGRLQLAIDYVLQPERMFDSNNFSSADMFLIIEKLMQYIEQLDSLVKTATIKDSDKILKKLAEDKNNDALTSDESKQAVNDFMSLFRKDSGIEES